VTEVGSSFIVSASADGGAIKVSAKADEMARAAEAYRSLGAEANLQVRYPDCKHSFPETERILAYEFLRQHLR